MSTVVALRVDRILSQCSACDELRWHAIVLGGLVVLIVTRYRSAQGYPSIRNEILVLLMGVREPNNLPQINSGLLSTCPLSRLGSNVQSILAVTPSSLSKLARIFDIQSSLALTLSSFAKLRRDRVLHRISGSRSKIVLSCRMYPKKSQLLIFFRTTSAERKRTTIQ